MASNWQQTYNQLKKKKKEIDKAENKKEIAKINQKYENPSGRLELPTYTGTGAYIPSKKDDSLLSAFNDGYDFGDVTKTILTGGKKLAVGTFNVGKELVTNPIQAVKTAGVSVANAIDNADTTLNNVTDDFFDWILKREDDDKPSLTLKEYEKLPYASEEEKQKVLKEYEEAYGIDSAEYKNIQTIIGSKQEESLASKILNPKYYKTDTYNKAVEGELTDGQQTIWNVGETIGNMLPSIAVSTVASPLAGSAVFYAQAQQNYTEEAKTRGYTDTEARTYGLIMGGAEVLVERLGFDELGGLNKLATSSIKKAMVGEGLEEFVMPYIDSTVKSVGFGEEFDLQGTTEEAIESFVMGAVTGGIMNAGGKGLVAVDRFIEKVNSGQEITQNDLVEAGRELEQTDPNYFNEIMKDVPQVLKDQMQSEDIAPVQQAEQQEIAPVQEVNPKQQNYQYKAQATDSIQRKTISEDASKYANNTKRTQELVDTLVNVSEATGETIRLTNNQSEEMTARRKQLAENYARINNVTVEEATKRFEKTTIDAYNTGKEIVINLDSPKALNRLVGHEVTHSLEGTQEYSKLQRIALDYAKTKGEYNDRASTLQALYEGTNANIDNELTSDLVGDYLFTDQNFINHLHTQDRNVFQKIYDEIKHLIKMVTAGSKEARQLEQLKHSFEKAIRENKASKTTTIESKSNLATEVESNTQEKEIEYSLMGEKGIKEAVRKDSENQWIIDNLDKAKKYSEKGIPSERIRKSTGWFKDANGKWLFEIPDNEIELNRDVLKQNSTTTLKELLPHEDLYEAYGDKLANTIVKIENIKSPDVVAQYNDKTGEISISNSVVEKNKIETIRRALLHEAHHKIQQIEGLENGKGGRNPISYYSSLGEIQATEVEDRSRKDYSWLRENAPESMKEYPIHSQIRALHKALTSHNPESMKKAQNILKNDSRLESLYNEIYKYGEEGVYDRKILTKMGITKNNAINDIGANTSKILSDIGKWFKDRHIHSGKEQLKALDNLFKEQDNKGRTLTKEQEDYFKDSKVRDENGNLLTMYHGTSSGGHTVFDPWGAKVGLFGQGSYFTDNQSVAESYTEKGRGSNKQIYEVYLNITNPIDMDAQGDVQAWAKALSSYGTDIASHLESGTNEQIYRSALDYLAEEGTYDKYERAEIMAETFEKMGYDGITHIGGGRFNKQDGTRHRVYISLDSSQVKNVDNTNPTQDADIRYSLSEPTTDNKGRQLSKQQIEKFKDSKIRDNNGNLKTMYHGTTADFTEFDIKKARASGTFGRGFYFSEESSHAGQYGKELEVYLDIKNPIQGDQYNITEEQLRNYLEEIAENEDYGLENYGYGVTVESLVESFKGKDDFQIFRDINSTAIGDFVEAVKLFNSVNGTNYDGIVSATETVAFYPNQIKNVDNTNPTSDPDIRYSLSEAGTHGNLMAIHNLNAEKLQGVLELGGFPLPSIAITKADTISHSSYGDISVLFDKNTIDPANKKNKVYSRDAYTPRFPNVTYKLQKEGIKEIASKTNRSYYDIDANFEGKTPQQATDSIKYDDKLLNDFLNENNLVAEEVYKDATSNYNFEKNTELKQFIIDNDITFEKLYANKKLRNEFYELHKAKSPLKGLVEKQVETWEKIFSQETININSASRFNNDFNSIKNGFEKVLDESGTKRAKLDLAEQNGYNEYVLNLVSKAFGDKYIRNDVETYTPSGTPRSFDKLYDEYNLENIVRAMTKKSDTGSESSMMVGINEIAGNSSIRFNSLDEIRNNKDLLQSVDAEEYQAKLEEYSERLTSIQDAIMERGHNNSDNYFIAYDNLGRAISESARDFGSGKKVTVEKVQKNIKEYGFNATIEEAQSILKTFSDLRTLPTEYFEAKPQRAVGLNEVQAIVIPNNTSTEFKQQLQDAGLKYYEYDSSIEGDRQRVINQFDDLKFSLSNQEQDIAPTSGDIYGSEVKLQQQVQEAIAPLQETIQELTNKITTLQENIAPIQGYTDEDINLKNDRNFESLEAQDIAPIENTTPEYRYENSNEITPINDPFENRDINELGTDRKATAYLVENPEVKPYFQQSAREMLNDLDNSIKGEKLWLQEYNPATGLMENGMVMGTKRLTTDDLAYLRDTFGYDTKDLRTGLNAIINDDASKMKLAVVKRIEFMLHDRLMKGYKSVDGFPIPANEEYRALIDNMNLQAYTDQAYQEWSSNINQDELAPIENASNMNVEAENIPLRSDKKAINQATKSNEPRIEFADPMEAMTRQVGKQIQEGMTYKKSEPKVSPTKKQQAKNMFGKLQDQFVNRNYYIDKFAKDTGNKQIKIAGDMVNNFWAEIDGEIFTAQTDNNGNAIGDSLSSLFKKSKQGGYYEAFNDYLMHQSNIDRHKVGKGSIVPLEYSTKMVAEYEKMYPTMRAEAMKVWKYGKNLLANMQSNGLITGQFNSMLQDMYPHYVPFMFDEEVKPFMSDDGTVRPKKAIKRAEGNAYEILEIEDAFAKYTYRTKRAIRENSLYKEIVKSSNEKVSIGADLRLDPTNIEEGLGIDDNGKYYVTSYVDGQMQQATISEDLYNELTKEAEHRVKAMEERYELITKPLQKISEVRRNLLTTWSPTFLITNPIKDIQDAVLNSKYTKDFLEYYTGGLNPLKSVFVELTQAKTKEAKQFLTLYGSGNSMAEYDTNGYTQNPNAKNNSFAKRIVNAVERANNILELAPRFAEFKASLKNGTSVQEAVYNAREVTLNFGRGGYITKGLNRNGFTFLNASVQGFDKLVRNFSGENGAKGIVSSFAKVGMFALAPALINALAFGTGDDEDEDYKALPDYIKDNYYIIKTEDGEFIRIPKGRMLSVFGSAGRRALELLNGDKEAFEGYLTNAYSQVGVQNPLESNIFAPFIQAFGSEAGTTWYGGDLVPTRLQDKPVEEQYDETTDEFSKWLGQMIGVSPYKLNYMLDQYSGGLGDLALPIITEEASSDGSFLAPIKDKFTANTTSDNKYVSEFYDKNDELKVKANSSKATEEDILKNKYMYSVSSEMSELYKEKREVQNDDSLTKEEKYRKVQEIQKQINSLAEEGLNNYERVNKTSNYAMVGDREYYKDANDEWKTPYEDELDELNSLGMDVEEKSDYFNAKNSIYEITEKYKGTEDMYAERKAEIIDVVKNSYLTDDQKGYLYSKYYSKEKTKIINALDMDFDSFLDYESQNFVADKNKYGESINGSKKTKVFDYINSLNGLSFEEKVILAKLEYNSYDEWNYEIIDYLNTSSITYEEEVYILKKLGFEVTNNGDIYW